MSDLLTFQPLGPGPLYQGIDIWLPLLLHENVLAGSSVIEGRTFTDCRIHGPALLIPVSGCSFDACNLGDSYGDMRNLLLQPMGPSKIVGGIAMKDCRFERCDFLAIGYSGTPDFLAQMAAVQGAPA